MKKQFNVSRIAATLALVPLAGAPFIAATPAHAQAFTPSAATVSVNGNAIAFPDQPPVNAGGRLLVPLRAIFEALGATVNYSNGTIRANRGTTNLELSLGSDQAIINGQRSTLDVPAQAVFGRTLVPLRFVGEAFGATVNYNPVTQAVTISAAPTTDTPATGTPAPPPGLNPSTPAYNVPGGTTVSGSLINVNTAGNTVTINDNGQTRIFPLAPGAVALSQISIASTPGATPLRQPARGIALNSLNNGDDVRINLDATGRATQIITAATVVVARVQFGGGNTIILDDDRDTTLTLGPSLSYIDAQGKPATSVNLRPGDNVALFLSRENRQVYRVSAYAPDYTPNSNLNTGTTDPIPGGGVPANSAPQIQLVSHNAAGPLKAGSRLDVTVRATTGQRIAFSLGARIQNVPLYESTVQPGVYNGSYTVKAGDDVLNARVLARLSAANGFEDTAQSVEPVTIDTVPPNIYGTFPANNGFVNVNQPNIVVLANDLNGSGLGGATMEIVNGNARIPVQATVSPEQVSATVPQPLSGLVSVRAVISDKAGNSSIANFSFTVAGATAGGIQSFSQGATRPLNTGETVPLILKGNPAGQASFDVIDANNRIVASNLPLTEDRNTPGTYRANYSVPDDARGDLRFVGRFSPGDGTSTTANAAAPVKILVPVNLSVTAPRDGVTVSSPLVVSGKGAPGSTVSVSIVATGTQLFILEYNEDLGTQQVRVDANGNWQTAAIQLPARKNVSNLSYVILATQTDGANATGDPITLTVKGR